LAFAEFLPFPLLARGIDFFNLENPSSYPGNRTFFAKNANSLPLCHPKGQKTPENKADLQKTT
jgi:hypothetical protein